MCSSKCIPTYIYMCIYYIQYMRTMCLCETQGMASIISKSAKYQHKCHQKYFADYPRTWKLLQNFVVFMVFHLIANLFPCIMTCWLVIYIYKYATTIGFMQITIFLSKHESFPLENLLLYTVFYPTVYHMIVMPH